MSLSALAVILALGSSPPVQPQPSRPAMPIEPISAIVQQFKSHTVVALGDNEASVQGSEFRIKLVRVAQPDSANQRSKRVVVDVEGFAFECIQRADQITLPDYAAGFMERASFEVSWEEEMKHGQRGW